MSDSNIKDNLGKREKSVKIVSLFIILQFGVLAYSLSNVCAKYASSYQILSWQFIAIYILDIIFLGIYAIIWQQIIKYLQLSIAYTSKAISLIGALIFGIIFFNETITINKIIGVIIVISGIIVVNLDLWKKS